QAEDGIRDATVTGVQTCALPISRYRQQSGLDPSQTVQEAALSAHPAVTRLILDLFRVRFDPAVKASVDQRQERAAAVAAEIEEEIGRAAGREREEGRGVRSRGVV